MCIKNDGSLGYERKSRHWPRHNPQDLLVWARSGMHCGMTVIFDDFLLISVEKWWLSQTRRPAWFFLDLLSVLPDFLVYLRIAIQMPTWVGISYWKCGDNVGIAPEKWRSSVEKWRFAIAIARYVPMAVSFVSSGSATAGSAVPGGDIVPKYI